jgi:hypothetical protein
MSKVDRLLRGIHFFVGIGAVFGGLGAILNPYGFMGITTDVLKYGPFKTFMIPGIFLFLVIGLGNIIVALFMSKIFKYQGYISGVFSTILVLWIVIQCIVLQSVTILHILYFLIGCIQGSLSIYILLQKKIFPFHRVKN